MKRIVLSPLTGIIAILISIIAIKFFPAHTILSFFQIDGIYITSWEKITKATILLTVSLMFIYNSGLMKRVRITNQVKNYNLYIFWLPIFLFFGFGDFRFPEINSIGLIVLILVRTLIVATTEEFIFRGYIQSVCIQKFGSWKGVLTASFLFALMHFMNLFDDPQNMQGITFQFLFAFAIGIILGYLFLKTQNIYPIIFLHFLFNIKSSFEKAATSGILTTESIEKNPHELWISTIITLFVIFLMTGIGLYQLRKT